MNLLELKFDLVCVELSESSSFLQSRLWLMAIVSGDLLHIRFITLTNLLKNVEILSSSQKLSNLLKRGKIRPWVW